MHEASIAQGILDVAGHAVADKPARIIRITVVAGVLAGVEPECLRLYFDELSRGTPAEGAELEVKTEPARLVCRQCQSAVDYHPRAPLELNCSKCGGPYRLEGGGRLFVESVEIES